MPKPALAVHGGSGDIPASVKKPDVKNKYKSALQDALDSGFNILKKNGSALESVIKGVCVLEDCELFNAGKGSVFNAKGKHRMDAAVMEGQSLKAGAVTNIREIKNPVLLAEEVLNHSQYVFLGGEEAVEFAKRRNFDFMPDSYFFTQHRYDQWKQVEGSEQVTLDHSSAEDKKFGTVGAVAVDSNGNVAAATSTGGVVNKAWGRIGDTPVIGAGTYADNETCAVSCTGYGEYFIRSVAAHDLSSRMKYKKLGLKTAADEVINKVKKMGGEGGLIAIDSQGNISMPFNSQGMYRGMKNERKSFTEIY